MTLDAPNIGDIELVKLRTSGTDTFTCLSIKIQIDTRFWTFDCEEEISCPHKCSTTISLAG